MRRFIKSIVVAGAILTGIPIPVIANDVTELNTLKGKYGAGTAKIDRSAYAAYTNAISALMQQFKSKGDLSSLMSEPPVF